MIIRKELKFEAAHRLTSAYSQRCLGIHGHSYRVELLLEGELNTSGMVVDFGKVKAMVASFIDKFDHSLIIHSADTYLVDIAPKLNSRFIIVPYNPTAENMCIHILTEIKEIGIPITAVKVHETVTGFAEVCIEDGLTIDLTKVVFSEGL